MFKFRIMKISSQNFEVACGSLQLGVVFPAARTSVADLELPALLKADQRLQAIESLRPRLLPLLNFLSLQPCRPSGHAARLPCEAQPGGEVMLLSLQHTRKR
jgi:hypothetical protein